MFIPVGTRERVARRRFPYVTVALVLVNSVVFLLELLLLVSGGQATLSAFILSFGVIPFAVTTGQDILIPFYLTLFTSMFVHGGLAHITFNMLYLLSFGDNVEDRLGHLRYLAFYIVAGLVATAVHIAVAPSSRIPSVGASGAIAGVLAGYVVLFPRGMVRLFLFFVIFLIPIARVPALLFIGIWFVTQFLSGVASLGVETAQTGGVAYWAHIGGFAGGFVLAGIYRIVSRR